MDFESLSHYLGKQVRLTLINNFWYRARITSISETTVTFIEAKGKSVSVHPSAILMIEEVSPK